MKITIRKALLIIIVSAPLFLLFLPADYFNSGDSFCLYKSFLDFNCPGCGLTRGLMHMIHLEMEAAWAFSPLTFIIGPLLAMVWLHLVGKLFNRQVFRFLERFY